MVPSINVHLFCVAIAFSLTYLHGAQFCATDGKDEPVVTDPAYMCFKDNFTSNPTPPMPFNKSTSNFQPHYCDIVFLLDLDQTITSEENYSQVIQFISDATVTCMDIGIGYKVFAWPLFRTDNTTETVCCDDCYSSFGFMDYKKYVLNYDSFDPVQQDTTRFNFSYTLIDALKRIGKPASACLFNNYVLISNRLFTTTELIDTELNKILDVGCITFTIIAVGNPDINSTMMYQVYNEITLDTYAVPGFNCLDSLKDCIRPCGTRPSQQCFQQELRDCPYPTTPKLTTTTTTAVPTLNPDYVDDWAIIYLFAISNKTKSDQFSTMVQYIADPLKNCENQPMIIRFLARNDYDSDWITDMSLGAKYLAALNYDEILLSGENTELSGVDNDTFALVQRAVRIPTPTSENARSPTIFLLTDFYSQDFVNHYNVSLPTLQKYDFRIICFQEEAYQKYHDNLQMKAFQLVNDDGYKDTKELRLCDSSSNVTTIMFIIIGTCSGAMLLLILLTVLYRQKYMWVRKLKRFKTSHNEDIDENDIIDHWELSWEKLVVKNDKLGHGAYGHVFKGKIIGIPPAVEKYNRTEAAAYIDCDCAVKMLPKYSTESSKQEFRHEIELMKNLGFNEHIVNMLGCITTSAKSCLVMEYCSNRDLLRYVKQRKAELEISRNVDDTIDSHKEFLNFGWQVSQGMRFLVDKQIIHRDLAARNVLISGFAGMKSAKVSDFGLALSMQPMEHGDVSASDRLPIKWLALECLEKSEFSHKSDVWSFGIVIFEMYSLGEVPFANIEPTELITHLKSGERPKCPLLATDKVAEIMNMCWEEKPMKRPDFDELSSMFATQLEQTAEGYGYLELIRTKDYRVVSEILSMSDKKDDKDKANGVDNNHIDRHRSVTWKRNKDPDGPKLGREYSLTTHVVDEEPSEENSTPRLPKENQESTEKEKPKRRNKSYINLPNLPNILPSLNSINPFSKENEFKKTIKRKFYSRRGSVPY